MNGIALFFLAIYIFLIGLHLKLKQIENIMATKVSELAANLGKLADQTDKIIKEIQTLKDSLANAEIPADAQASLDRLGSLIQQADDANPDAPLV